VGEGKEERILGGAEGEGGPRSQNNPIKRGQPASILPTASPVSQPAPGTRSLSSLYPQKRLASFELIEPRARGPRSGGIG
jgi:hypothetical protein